MRSIILYAGLRIQKGVQSRPTSSILLFSAQPALHNNNFVSAMTFSMFPTAMSDMFSFFVAQNPFKAVRLKHISRNVIWIWFQTPEECSLVLVFHVIICRSKKICTKIRFGSEQGYSDAYHIVSNDDF